MTRTMGVTTVITSIIVAVLLTLTLNSCGDGTDGGPDGVFSDTEIYEVQTDYGPLLCVVWNSVNKGGISCTPLGWNPTDVTR